MAPPAPSPDSQEYRVLKEKVEVLNGDRGANDKAALRRGEATDLRQFIAKLRTGQSDIQIALDKAGTQLSAAQTQLNTLSVAITSTSGDIAALRAAVKAAAGAVDSANTEVAALQRAVTQISADGGDLATTLAAMQTAAAAVSIPALTSADVTLAPTAADYNALRADVVAIHTAVGDLKAAIG